MFVALSPNELWMVSKLSYFLPGIFLAIVIRKLLPWMWLSIAIELFGVFLHELSHALVGFLLGAQPTGGTLIPKKLPDGSWILGSVRLKNVRWFNGFFISMAPLLIPFLFIPFIPLQWSLLQITKTDIVIWGLMALILPASIPSKIDLRVGIKSLAPILILIAILLIAALIMVRLN